MSKNIVIQEGGVGKQLTADKLKTNLVGGGTCLWVPEDETPLGTKYISENGTYNASSDGLYGFSSVTVSGVGSVSGKDPDGSGDDAMATVDPDTGEIKITKLPSSISVVTPPTNPYGVYVDGQSISKDGMVVKGYLKDGTEWGTIPNSDITLNPTTADFSQTHGYRIATSDEFPYSMWPSTVNALKSFASTTDRTTGEPYATYSGPCYFAFRRDGNSTLGSIACSDNQGSYIRTVEGGSPVSHMMNTTFTYNGKTVYYDSAISQDAEVPSGGINQHQSGASSFGANYAAWTVVYGDVTQEGNAQTITVSWQREDGETLETSFEILVAPSPSGDGEENGNASGIPLEIP